MKKIIFATVMLICSVALAGQNPLSIQPYVSGSLRAAVGSQQSYELNRMLIGMWCYPTGAVEMLFEYNGVTAKPTFAFGRAHRAYGRWEVSALVGRHKNPVWYTVPTIHDLRLPRFDIAMEPFASSAFATGVGAWVKYDSLATLRVSSFDSTDASVCLTVAGISQYWQDGVGYGGGVNLADFMRKFGKPIAYRGYELMPYFACVDLNEGRDPCSYGLDLSSPYPVQLHWLTEGTNVDTWHSFGASVQYLRRSFIKLMYDGRFETTRVDVSFYAAW